MFAVLMHRLLGTSIHRLKLALNSHYVLSGVFINKSVRCHVVQHPPTTLRVAFWNRCFLYFPGYL